MEFQLSSERFQNKVLPSVNNSNTTKPLQEFLASSCRCQTLYAKCEESYTEWISDSKYTKLVKIFISSVLNNNQEENYSDSTQVEKIIKKVCARFTKHDLNEIYLTVIWVYYFKYSTETTESTPLFKMFKRNSQNAAFSFFDVDGNFYGNWDYYLGNAPLPTSLICVPRDGKYYVPEGSEIVDLEYLCYKPLILSRTLSFNSLKPSSCGVIESLTIKLRSFFPNSPIIEDFLSKVWRLVLSSPVKKLIILILKVIIQLNGGNFSLKAISTLVLQEIFFPCNENYEKQNELLEKLLLAGQKLFNDFNCATLQNFLKNLQDFNCLMSRFLLK